MKRALLTAALVLVASRARATGFSDAGEDLHPRAKTEVTVEGAFRTRTELLHNLDLDRGLDPSGSPLFPTPEGNPTAQTFVHGDMRLRTDLAVYTAGGMVAVKTRIDVLDNVAFGGNAAGIPSASSTQRTAAGDAFRIKRAYGEVKLPFGLLAAGRMGNHWGLGMLANGGDCGDCDSGDAQDRLAFITPLLGHLFAIAYDFSAVSNVAFRKDGVRRLGLAPATAVHTFTFAMLHYTDALGHARRRDADKSTVDYGAYVSHRFQQSDAPYEYLSIAQDARPTRSPVVVRGFRATAFDAWFRWVHPHGRIELEGALLFATVDNPSLLPGVTSNRPVTSRQVGVALQSDLGAPQDPASAGLDLGYASGDSAPGFGAFPDPNAPPPKPGDLDGAQANLPRDTRVDNFRFHPDYRIDRILFREIIGTVTDAIYVRPRGRVDLWRLRTGVLSASLVGVMSWAVFASSTPGGKTPLGIELDPTIQYVSRDGFAFALEHAVLFPLAGLDNPSARLSARPAQLLRLRLMYLF